MIKGGKEGGERAVTRTTKKEKRKKKSILKNGEKRGNSFSLFLFLSFFLPLSRVYQRERNKEFERQISIETAHQVRPVDPLERDDERRCPQRQLLLLRDPPEVSERRRHRLVEAPLGLLGRPAEVLDVLDPLEERDGDAAAAGELSGFFIFILKKRERRWR